MTRHRRTLLAATALILLSLLSIPSTQPAFAQSEQCFPQTNQCISGRFRQYWEQNGGLAVFGYPISAPREEPNQDTGQSYLTQWFERNRFELHPENAAPYDVLLGRLGDARLRQLDRDWQELPRDDVRQAGCLWFQQTQFNLCDTSAETGVSVQTGFMTYWQTHGLKDPKLDAYGRSLALFGLPLTRPRMETNASGDNVLTQWFERARMEFHPDNPAGFKVLLGLLGNEVSMPGQPQPPAGRMETYIGPGNGWAITYPADLLHPEQLGDGTVIFISQDRGTVAAVDSYIGQATTYGNTGEGLRNRARDTLARIYSRPVEQTGAVERPGVRWEVGLSFRTAGGSGGEAVYEQRGRQGGNYRVHGVLFGYKTNNAASAAAMVSALRAMRDSFQTAPEPAQALINYFQLLNEKRYGEAVSYYGGDYEQLRIFNPSLPPNNHAGLFEYACGGLLHCLQVRRIDSIQEMSPTEWRFVVEFSNEDGSLFQVGPLEMFEGVVHTQFPYTVKKNGNRYVVMELPVYTP